jgi:hypothetical protein
MNLEMTETVNVTKGEDIVKLRLRRSSRGLTVSILKVHKCIEEMFREWSNGETVPYNSHGRKWIPSGKLPGCYSIQAFQDILGVQPCKGGRYRLDSLGTDIYVPGIGGEATVNMSFLRFIGASDGPLEFYVKGVYSKEAMDTLKRVMHSAILQLYIDLLKPIDVVITMSSSETSKEL